MFGDRNLPIAIENPVVCPVVDRASDSEHGVAGLLDPPGAGALHPFVADEFVGRFKIPATDGITSQTPGQALKYHLDHLQSSS
jgi:hypothetical protein